MSSFYIVFFWQTKYVLNLKVCSTSTAVSSVYRTVFMASMMVCIWKASASGFHWNGRRHFRGALSATWHGDCWMLSWIFWRLVCRGCLKMSRLLLWSSGCFSTSTMEMISGSGRLRCIREGRLDMWSRLHSSVRDLVYVVPPRTIKILVIGFKAVETRVDENMLKRVRHSAVRCTAVCLEMDGGRFEITVWSFDRFYHWTMTCILRTKCHRTYVLNIFDLFS
jgi:hypothetical protein